MHTPKQMQKKAMALKEAIHHTKHNVVGEKNDNSNVNMNQMGKGMAPLDTPTEEGMSA